VAELGTTKRHLISNGRNSCGDQGRCAIVFMLKPDPGTHHTRVGNVVARSHCGQNGCILNIKVVRIN